MIPKDEFRRAASASLKNGTALYEDAFLLFGAQRYARSLSLSVIGLEEIGKAFLYLLAALDGLPDLRQKLERSKRGNPAHSHVSKKLLCEYASIAEWQVGEFLQILAQETGEAAPVSDLEWLTELLVTLIKHPSSAKVSELSKNCGDKKLLTSDEKKERGLYVDLSPEFGLSTPEQIRAEEAECELADLKSSLKYISRLSRVLESEDKWQLLENTGLTRPFTRVKIKK
jgi:AbiV family abortive infection protein